MVLLLTLIDKLPTLENPPTPAVTALEAATSLASTDPTAVTVVEVTSFVVSDAEETSSVTVRVLAETDEAAGLGVGGWGVRGRTSL